MTWIAELESAQLGTVKIGTYPTKLEAYEATDEWLRETRISDGKREITMLELVNESFSDDIYIYQTNENLPWEEEND